MSYEEIATKLRRSMAKVKTDIFRAREALRKKLKLDLEGDRPVRSGWRAATSLAHPA